MTGTTAKSGTASPTAAATPIATAVATPAIVTGKGAQLQVGAMPKWAIYERDTKSGDPAGWSTRWNKGRGRILVPLTTDRRTKLFARLIDAGSPGATETVGTGTILQDVVQVADAVASGQASIPIEDIPAGMPRYVMLELSGQSDFSDPVRIPSPFAVGQRVFVLARSYMAGWGSIYAYGPEFTPPDLTVISPYTLASSFCAGDPRYSRSPGDWDLQNGVGAEGKSSTLTMEFCRVMHAQTGVMHGVVGMAALGGGIMDHLSRRGVPSDPARKTLESATPGLNKFSWFVFGVRDGDLSEAQARREYEAIADWIDANARGPVGMCFSIASGVSATNGSFRPIGYSRQNDLVLQMEKERPNVVMDASDWQGQTPQWNPHPTMISRAKMARSIARALLTTTPNDQGGIGPDRGPTLADVGTREAGSFVLRLPYTLVGGGTSLRALKMVQPYFGGDPKLDIETVYSDPTPWDCRFAFTVRLQGETWADGRKDARDTLATGINGQFPAGVTIKLDQTQGVRIDNARREIRVALSQENPGKITFADGTTMPLTDALGFTVQHFADFDTLVAPASNAVVIMVDDRIGVPGYPYGWPLRPKLDIFVAAPAPAAQALTMTQPATTVNGGWLELSGRGAGAPVAGQLRFSVNGAAPMEAAWQFLTQDNRWQATMLLPASTDSRSDNTVAVYRPGQAKPDATRTFATATRIKLLGAPSAADQSFASLSPAAVSSYVESYWARNGRTMWRDAAATTRLTANLQAIGALDGESGNVGNRLTGAAGSSPSIDFSGLRSYFEKKPTVLFEPREALASRPDAPLLKAMQGDFTIAGRFAGGGYKGVGGFAFAAGTDNGIGFNDVYNLNVWRGKNALHHDKVSFGSTFWLSFCLRYRMSDGLLELFMPFWADRGEIAQTVAPEALTLTAFLLTCGNFGSVPGVLFFNSRFSDTDRDAVLAAVANI